MAKPGFQAGQANHILTQVYEGMTVYSRTGDKIGTVEYVCLGELTEAADEHGQELATPPVLGGYEGSLIEDFTRTIVLPEQVPDILRDRLLRHGFIRINSAGLFAADRCVMPDQIASVSDDGVTLRVSRNELMKL
jgi:hypothetical protein